jgi:hypothetical protein
MCIGRQQKTMKSSEGILNVKWDVLMYELVKMSVENNLTLLRCFTIGVRDGL